MKKERKEELLRMIPKTPKKIMNMVNYGKGYQICVLLTNGHELFARCYLREKRYVWSDKEKEYHMKRIVTEVQRYAFAKDGAVRYSYSEAAGWHSIRFQEPVFKRSPGYMADIRYDILNFDAVAHSDLRYCMLDRNEAYVMSYLKLYIDHPNIEYLIKSGYRELIISKSDTPFYYSFRKKRCVDEAVDLSSNNLLKMLHLNRTEFFLLRGRERLYKDYIAHREKYPNMKPKEVLLVAKVYGSQFGLLDKHIKDTGLKPHRIARYLIEHQLRTTDYSDYLDQCRILKYNLADTAISMPHNFNAMHERLSQIIVFEKNEAAQKMLETYYPDRQPFEFENEELFLRQPKTVYEIIEEGKVLHHCVGGYAERHAYRRTNIFFIRRKSDPGTPYYTIEVSNDYHIVQCRGFKNDAGHEKPDEIKAFEQEYQKYLEELKHEQQRINLRSA